MAKNVAHWQFEEDDTVAILPKSGGIRIGLVSETHEDESSSEDDESVDSSPRLKTGQIRVEWYPTGKDTPATTDKVILLDRSLLMGEVVCRRSQPNRIGSIRSVSIRADFLILPQCQYVVRNISDARIEFVNKYDDASSSCYVGYDNWAGGLMASSDKLLMKSEEGYQCWVSTNEMINDLYDCCTKRLESSSYNTRQWYEGEPVKCSFKSLENAKWLPNHKPPDSVMRKLDNNNRKMKFTVIKVEPEFINVRWISAVGGPNASLQPPPSTINGEDLQKVRKLEHFEHQLTQIGDRIWVDIRADDAIVPYADWKATLRSELEREQHRARATLTSKNDGGRVNGSASASNDTDLVDSVHSATLCSAMQENESIHDVITGEGEGGFEDTASVTVDGDWGTQRKSRSRLGITAHRWKSHVVGSSTSPPYRKTQSAVRKRPKLAHPKNAKTTTVRINPIMATPNLGERVAGEAIYVRSFLEIMWQDGEVETNVPSAEIAYASGDLDDHLFVPGNFVLLQEEDDDNKTWPEYGYGVVEKVDYANRVATVSWYEQTNEPSAAASKRNFIRKDDVSVYELILHPDYDYPPGVLLMLVSPDFIDPNDTFSQVGQVLYTDVNGEVVVKWMNGETGRVLPEQVYRVLGDYQFGEDESEVSVSDEEENSDGESDSDSWSTVSMDSETSDDDEEEHDKFDLILGSEPKVKPKDAIDSLIKLSSALDALRGSLMILRKSESDITIRRDLASALAGLYFTLKRLAKCWFGLDLNGHRYGGDLSSCVRILRAWLKTMKEKENSSSGENGKAHTHPAKENGITDRADIESQLDVEVALLCQVEEALKKFSGDAGGEASNSGGSTSSATDHGWMGLMRKTIRSFLRQIQSQTTGNWSSPAAMRWRLSGSGLSVEEEEKLALTQRLLQRNLELREENVDHPNAAEEPEPDREFLTSTFRSVVNDCANRCFEANPRHKRALAIVDLSAAGILMASRLIIEQLVIIERDGGKADGWPSLGGIHDGSTSEESAASSSNVNQDTKSQNKNQDGTGDGENLIDLISDDCGKTYPDATHCVAKQEPFERVGLMDQKSDEEGAMENGADDPSNNVDAKGQRLEDGQLSEMNTPTSTSSFTTASTGTTAADCFELLDKAPTNHIFMGVGFDSSSVPGRFMKAVGQEMKLLQHLPAGVYVKGFENRMDLYSCMLVGPTGTPYTDGLFFFDVHLKPSYPTEPPVFHFKSFSTEQLNPNLYQDGKVCVSLLGTWNGKDSEMWNPGSNLLQVLVSIQGLILNAEPYFNEAGFEAKRAHPESVEKSRRYNELALIRTIESLWKLSTNPPFGFEKDVHFHLAARGRNLIEMVGKWIEGSPCGFPLQPVSQGFALSARKQLAKFAQVLTNLGF